MGYLKKLQREISLHRAGIVIGALAGLIVSLYLGSRGADMSFAIQSRGFLDSALSNVGNLALTKVTIGFMTIGAMFGYAVDKFMP